MSEYGREVLELKVQKNVNRTMPFTPVFVFYLFLLYEFIRP